MVRRERVVVWWVVVVVMAGLVVPLAGQEGEVEPSRERAIELLRQVALSGESSGQVGLATAWIEALEAEFGSEHPTLSRLLLSHGMGFYRDGEYRLSLIFLERRHQILTSMHGPESLETLAALNHLAPVAQAMGDLPRAEELLHEALAIRRRIQGDEHPDTLKAKAHLAGALEDLGDLAGIRHRYSDFAFGQRFTGERYTDASANKERLPRDRQSLGDLASVRQREEETLVVSTFSSSSDLAGWLGDLDALAEVRQRYEEALAVRTWILGEGHPRTWTAKANLAGTFVALGDLAGARQRFGEVLAALEGILGEEHPETLAVKTHLASVLFSLGELAGARQGYEEVLAVRTRLLGEEHLQTLTAKTNLAGTLYFFGDLAGATQLEEEVLAVWTRILGEEHPQTLVAKARLAGTLRAQGDLTGSRQHYEELLEIRAQLLGSNREPNTLEEADEFFWLAWTLRRLGEVNGAYASYLNGLDALEAQVLRASRSEVGRSRFRERYGRAYRDTLATGLELDRPEDAFLLLERYRTQSLMNLLRWSPPDSGVEIPDEWHTELAKIALEYDRNTRQLDALYPERDPYLDAEQTRLSRRRELIRGQIIELRREVEGVPEPLDFETLRASLDSGTVLLAYSIGSDEGDLFVLSREHGIEVHPIASEASQLWLQVGRLRTIDLGGREVAEAVEDPAESRQALAFWLFDKLLSPAADRIVNAERVLVLPDGPLYYLTFPALTRSVAPTRGDPRGWQYLAEWKPFHTVQSVTVNAELQARRPEPSDSKRPVWQWVGFGDPFYPSSQTGEAREPAPTPEGPNGQPTDTPWSVLRSTTGRGIWDGLTTLPHTQREIEEIQSQFPDGQAKAFLDRDATEDEARELLGTTRIAHFAAHGLADPDYPLDSFLALSLLEGDDREGHDLEHNGLLQAWEIIDHLQLDADLVVLSACVTAFGPERGGEGLISLSRAFQIAGARSVLASLWAVNDQSTSELMIRFYRNLLEKGMTKDVALQQAQIELIRGPIETVDPDGNPTTRDFSAPYHWAAFQLIGDWQ